MGRMKTPNGLSSLPLCDQALGTSLFRCRGHSTDSLCARRTVHPLAAPVFLSQTPPWRTHSVLTHGAAGSLRWVQAALSLTLSVSLPLAGTDGPGDPRLQGLRLYHLLSQESLSGGRRWRRVGLSPLEMPAPAHSWGYEFRDWEASASQCDWNFGD